MRKADDDKLMQVLVITKVSTVKRNNFSTFV